MPNTLKIKRGLASSIPQGQLAEPLFTTDTYDLYIGKGSGGNQRIQNYIASGTTNDILRGDGSVYTFPLGISSPSAGQVLKYNGTSWVNDSDAGITGTGTTNTLPKFTGATTLGNSNVTDSGTLITLGSNSYVNGSLGIGVTPLDWVTIRANKNITGNATSTGISQAGVAQSDVSTVRGFINTLSTQAASFTLTDYFHYFTIQGTIGAGSTVTNQYGFWADSSLTGATNNYGFYGNIASGTNRWNLYMNGTANNYMAGSLGIGATGLTGYNLRVSRNITGAIASYGIVSDGVTQSDVTTSVEYFRSSAATQAASFTLFSLTHYNANQGTFGASSAVTNQSGFSVSANMVGATNNYGFRGLIPSGSNRWNLYMDGTAPNYMAGALGIGSTPSASITLLIGKNITGAVTSYGTYSNGTIQSDVTTNATYHATFIGTAAASFTVNNAYGHYVGGTTIGAGSAISTQQAYYVHSTLTGATNNYAFRSILAAATGVWNLYMDGTANNYMAGSLGIGSTSLTQFNLRLQKNIVGDTTSYGISSEGTIQSTVTVGAAYYSTSAATQATTFTLANLYHYVANQGTLGAGSTITNQYGFFANTQTNATNNYGFYGNIASGTNRWNLYMNGTANNYMAGSLGIGSTSLANYNLRVDKTITGNPQSKGIFVGGIIQSDVTTSAVYFESYAQTAAAAFTLGELSHFKTNQSTIGAGSAITNQYGFYVTNGLTSATNNYGFFGQLAAASNVWNLYMNGTANNYLAGSLGIGSTSLTGMSLRVGKNITGATTGYGIHQDGVVQSDVTAIAHGFTNRLQTQATAFTLPQYNHYYAVQVALGAGSAVTTQAGFFADSSLTGATNNYGFYGNIASGTNRWNLYMGGTANNYMAGSLGIGVTPPSTYNLAVGKNITGGTTAYGIGQYGTVQSDVTSSANGIINGLVTAAASFTLTNYRHFYANQSTIGAGSTVTNQNGFVVDANMIGATNNYGFRGGIPSGTNRWNLYMDGTADNYLAGSLGIGSTSLSIFGLRLSKTITGGTIAYGQFADGAIQSDVTSEAMYYSTNATTAASAFTLTNLFHFRARYNTFGATSAVTNQYGFYVDSALTAATNNFGFYGNIASGANRWNLYMNGTAANYLAGNTLIGTTTDAGYKLDVNGTARVQDLVHLNNASGGQIRMWTSTANNSGIYGINSSATGIYGNAHIQFDLFVRSTGVGIKKFGQSSLGNTNNICITNNNTSLEPIMITTTDSGAVGIMKSTSTIPASAVFEIESTTKGFLQPRMTTTQRDAISSPATGLTVYNTTTNTNDYYNGTSWLNIGQVIVPANNQTGISISGSSLTGTNAQSLLDLSQTWNTTGYPTAIKLNITNTASGILANLMDLQVGGATQFLVDKAGAIKTSAPSGGTAGKWKLGSKVTATVALVTTDYIELEVDGVAYKVGLVS